MINKNKTYLFNFIYHYFKIFFISYIIVLFTKIFFIIYLYDNFNQYNITNLLYAIFWGYKFDFATSSFISLFSFLLSFNKSLYKLINPLLFISLLIIQISDILYFHESNRHIGYEITDIFTDSLNLFMTALTQYKIVTITTIFLSILFFILFYNLFNKQNFNISIKRYILNLSISFVLSIFFIRGMFQHIPLNPWQSNQIGDSKLALISINATYNILYSLATKSKKLKPIILPTIKNNLIKQTFKELYPNNQQIKYNLPIIKTKPNIVFLFLESWSLKYITPKITPNYYAILKQSIHPTYMIAGGHRTTEGLFCTLASYPNPLGKTIAKTQLQNYNYNSIIKIFNKQGYNSSFFQGTAKETSGTGSFAQSLGFVNSYGKHDIKKRIYEPNTWGVHDIDLYNFAQTKLKEPFIIGINGATTHDNKLPKQIKQLKFSNNSYKNSLLNTLHFSDFALKQFIDQVEIKYPNTIFVLFADHCGGGLTDTLENYQIPFAIYSKKLIKPKYYNTILSQRDIAPTILDLTLNNYKQYAPNFTGKSLITDKKYFANYYHNGILGWIENNNLLELNIATNKYNCFNIRNKIKIKTTCNKIFKNLYNHNLSFTIITQQLLFNKNSNKFYQFR